jgi:hypothetical protein
MLPLRATVLSLRSWAQHLGQAELNPHLALRPGELRLLEGLHHLGAGNGPALVVYSLSLRPEPVS